MGRFKLVHNEATYVVINKANLEKDGRNAL